MSFLNLRSVYQPVIISTQAPTSVSNTSATANGTLLSSRASTVTELGFVYSTSANPTINDTKATVSFTYGTYSASLSGLSTATTYHIRAYVTIAGLTDYGDDFSFLTTGVPVVSFGNTLLLMGVA